jgi:hypothetical protein
MQKKQRTFCLKRSVTSHKNSRPFSRQLQQLRHSRLAGNDEKNSCPMSPEIPEASVYYNLAQIYHQIRWYQVQSFWQKTIVGYFFCQNTEEDDAAWADLW